MSLAVGSHTGRPLLLVIESDPAVRRVLEAAGRDRLRFHFAESLSDRILDPRRSKRFAGPCVALIEIHRAGVDTLARLAQFRRQNPDVKVLLTVCYDSDYQLAADRLRELSERIVFRPFEVEPVLRTLIGLGLEAATERTGGLNG